MVMIIGKRAGAVLALAAGLAVAASLPALSQGYRSEGDERGNVESQRPPDERGNAEGHRSHGFGFHFNDDERGNVEGKRAACETYARVALVQAEANRKYIPARAGRSRSSRISAGAGTSGANRLAWKRGSAQASFSAASTASVTSMMKPGNTAISGQKRDEAA